MGLFYEDSLLAFVWITCVFGARRGLDGGTGAGRSPGGRSGLRSGTWCCSGWQ